MERLPGVRRATVSRQAEEAQVVYDDSRQTPERLAAAIDRLGFEASVLSVSAAPRPTLYVDGLSDLKAVRRVEQVLKAIKGVRNVTVDPRDGEVFIEYDGQTVTPHEMVTALERAGVRARAASP